MRALIIADEAFALRERGLVKRLEIGLADEGVRVFHAIPEAAVGYANATLYSRTISFDDRWWRVGLGAAAREIIRGLRASDAFQDPEGIDVVHVFGGSAWGLGEALATELEASLVVEVWRAGMVERARRMAERSESPIMFLAPDPLIEKQLRETPGLTVRHVPWGVHTPSEAHQFLAPSRAPTAMIVGAGRDAKLFAAALTGLAKSIRVQPDLMIFCDALAARRAGLWRLAGQLGIRDRLSLIAEIEGRSDLVMHGDLLIQPTAGGEQRSVTLEAMAHAMVVVAAADANVSTLIDNQTCRLARAGDAEDWARVLAEVMSDVPRSRALTMSARQFVREHRRASDQVRGVLEAYAWTTGNNAIPMAAGPGR